MVKKRSVIFVILFLIIFVPIVSAGSIGISPAGHKLFFEHELEKTFTFKFFSSSDEPSTIYVRGDLAEYVTLSEDTFTNYAIIYVTIKLPKDVKVPGNHRILIGAVESKSFEESSSGIGGLAAIQVPIDIYVPYPGTYAETEFLVGYINSGEKANFTLKVNNLGTEPIYFKPVVSVYENEERLLYKDLGGHTLDSKKTYTIKDNLATENLDPGVYKVVLNYDYGKPVVIERVLKVGTLYVNITDYSYKFTTGVVNNFYLEGENLWNSPLEKVYADVFITNDGNLIDDFRLTFVDFAPWEKKNLTGFFDCTGIPSGKYTANMIINYEGKQTQKLVKIHVKEQGMSTTTLIIAIIIGILLVIIIGMEIRIRFLKSNKVSKVVKVIEEKKSSKVIKKEKISKKKKK